MKFTEYYKYFKNEDARIEDVKNCAEEYIRTVMIEQTVSIGQPSKVKLNDDILLVTSEENNLQVEIDSYKHGTSLYLEISVNDNLHRVSINPLYFEKENIKNYIRECELDIKDKFSIIRQSVC